MVKKYKSMRGITLVALVVTIVVLLILAGITISTLSGNNGILSKAKDAANKTKQAQSDEGYALESLLGKISSVSPSTDGFNTTGSTEIGKQVNNPKITKGMIPIKWKNENWIVCSQDDQDWYSYDDNRQWANIMLSDGTYKSDSVEVGTTVAQADLGSMYVWIPRYAYKIAGEKNIEVTFLQGNTNTDKDGNEYTTNENTDTSTTAIVHPAFNSTASVTGLWVAKFESSGTNSDGQAVGNANRASGAQQYAPDTTTIAKSLPSKVSWRHITIGESETRCIAIAGSDKASYGLDYASSHLIKNDEWGAVAYLCYSSYGSVPKTNGSGSLVSNSHWYNMYTGAGPLTSSNEGWYGKNNDSDYNDGEFTESKHGYTTENGKLASTTGNATGIYDMNGGAWERVAGYLDNETGNLNTYGISADGSIKYFENGKLNSSYSSIWNAYTVGNEEKSNAIKISDSVTLQRDQLWNWNLRSLDYQKARFRITKATYDNMANHKGIGVNEVASSFAFYAPYSPPTENSSQPWGWFTSAEVAATTGPSQTYGRAWDNDMVLIGHVACPFVVRGGYCGSGSSAGVLASYITGGYASDYYGFRSVLLF